MSAYDDIDKSPDAGAPVECYRVHSQSFAQIFRYTNAEVPIAIGGQTYNPRSISRNNFAVSSIIDSLQTCDIKLPASDNLAQLCCFQKLPKDVFVTVYRRHRQHDDFKVEWLGTMIGAGARGNEAWLKTGNLLQAKLQGDLNLPVMQRWCNNELGDARCGVDLDAFSETVALVASDQRYLTLEPTSFPAGTLVRGVAKNLRTGEEHPIIWHNDQNMIGVGYPFVDIEVGDDIKVTRGCNYLRLGDCKIVYDNVDRYTGMDLAPKGDIFARLNLDTITSTNESVSTSTSEAAGQSPEEEGITWLPPGFV